MFASPKIAEDLVVIKTVIGTMLKEMDMIWLKIRKSQRAFWGCFYVLQYDVLWRTHHLVSQKPPSDRTFIISSQNHNLPLWFTSTVFPHPSTRGTYLTVLCLWALPHILLSAWDALAHIILINILFTVWGKKALKQCLCYGLWSLNDLGLNPSSSTSRAGYFS